MLLKDVPFAELAIGDRVISAKGKPGAITRLDHSSDPDRRLVSMVWEDNGQFSSSKFMAHNQMDSVEYLGRTKPAH